MWSLALSSLRFRWLSFVGIFVTVMAAATLVTATGSLLEGGIRGAVPPERLAGADIVVAADQTISETAAAATTRRPSAGSVVERVRIPADLRRRSRRCRRGRASWPTSPSPPTSWWTASRSRGPAGRPSLGHSWSSCRRHAVPARRG